VNNKVIGSLGASVSALNDYKLIVKTLNARAMWCNLLYVVYCTQAHNIQHTENYITPALSVFIINL